MLRSFRARAAALGLLVVVGATAYAALPTPGQLALLLNGTPVFQESTASTSPTAATITATAGTVIRIQCDAATYIYIPGTATSSNGEKVPADERNTYVLPIDDGTISILAVSGTVNCKRWNMK